MAKKTKYPDIDLTDEDKELVQQVAFRYAAKFYALTEKYSNPKKYAEKFILKKLRSDKNQMWGNKTYEFCCNKRTLLFRFNTCS